MTHPPQSQPGWHPDPSGPRPPKKTSKTKVVLGVVGGLIVLSAIGNAMGDDDKKSGTPSPPASAESVQHSAAPTETVAPAGSAVRDGKFEFQVVDITRSKTVSDPTGNPYMTATAQGEFIVVTLSVKNIGNQPQSYFGDNQKIVDAAGREYGASSEADLWMNSGDNPMGDINPGNSIEVKVAFDVPPNTNPAELELHDSMFSGGVSVRLA